LRHPENPASAGFSASYAKCDKHDGESQGFSGAEKSLLWAAILLFFVIRGGNRQSVDARIGKAF
jgi:uncharacterized membrane protein YphA (DoxX/SURF4 family)